MSNDNLDFENRQLCPDGACIGLLDQNGTCKECGKSATNGPYRGEPGVLNGEDEDQWEAGDEDDEDEDDGEYDDPAEDDDLEPEEPEEVDGDDEPAAAPAWDDRSLCPDGACIGVLRADGRCPECGHQATK